MIPQAAGKTSPVAACEHGFFEEPLSGRVTRP